MTTARDARVLARTRPKTHVLCRVSCVVCILPVVCWLAGWSHRVVSVAMPENVLVLLMCLSRAHRRVVVLRRMPSVESSSSVVESIFRKYRATRVRSKVVCLSVSQSGQPATAALSYRETCRRQYIHAITVTNSRRRRRRRRGAG